MSRRLTLFALLMLVTLGVSAQRGRRKAVVPSPEELAEQARQERFERKLQTTEKVIFIDSLVVPLDQLFSALSVSEEVGSIESYASHFSQGDTSMCSVWVNQLGDKKIFSRPTGSRITLFQSELIGSEWTAAKPLTGLEADSTQNYPFMQADGTTLYYAAKSAEGLGGWDIYMTRYDADEHRFLSPENIGMPFNSSANDYLYIVDDYNQLGWFVTDRGQSEGNVCIYTFVPNSSRDIYNEEELGRDRLLQMASIHRIQDTWTDNARVKDAMDRLVDMRKSAGKKRMQHDFDFVINDRLTYTTLSQFRHEESRQKAQQWLRMKGDSEALLLKLNTLRQQYAEGDSKARTTLAPQILPLEAEYEQMLSDLHNLEKNIRQTEN